MNSKLLNVDKNPVVFLDIDGVLNSGIIHESRTWEDNEEGFLHYSAGNYVVESKLKVLLGFLFASDARVVGVSSWFHGENDRTLPEHLEENLAIARFLGMEDIFLGCTEYTGGGKARGRGVLEYVEKHGIKIWGVLDDSGDMYDFPIENISGRFGVGATNLISLYQSMRSMS